METFGACQLDPHTGARDTPVFGACQRKLNRIVEDLRDDHHVPSVWTDTTGRVSHGAPQFVTADRHVSPIAQHEAFVPMGCFEAANRAPRMSQRGRLQCAVDLTLKAQRPQCEGPPPSLDTVNSLAAPGQKRSLEIGSFRVAPR